MQFNIPQFVDVEDKILGPLTLKQFLLFLGAGIFLVILWSQTTLAVTVVVGTPVVAFLLATVFIKINGRTFFSIFVAWFNYFSKPRIFVWRRKEKS